MTSRALSRVRSMISYIAFYVAGVVFVTLQGVHSIRQGHGSALVALVIIAIALLWPLLLAMPVSFLPAKVRAFFEKNPLRLHVENIVVALATGVGTFFLLRQF